MLNTYVKMIALIAIIGMFTSAAMGAVVTQNVEIRGSVMDGNGTNEYDYSSFAGFWYNLDKDQSSETMNITVTGERTINESDLVYTCTPQMVDYKSPGLKTDYVQYKIIGFMAEKFICYDNRTDQLVKLLIEWDSSDKMVLSMDGSMDLPEGYALVVAQIDLQGDKVQLNLYKDGKEIDDCVVVGGDTYTYEGKPRRDNDNILPLLSAQIESVFRGTESNLVVVKYVFMRSDTILDIDGGDTFGSMEVKSTASSGIILENDETLTLDSDSEVDIMDGLYFKVADDSSNLRYYLAKTVSLVCPECPECPEPEPCPEVETTNDTVVETADVTPPEIVEAIPDAEPEDRPTAVPTKKTAPGFESVFALAGLLGVALIVLRQRE